MALELIRNGANVNASDHGRRTPLHTACIVQNEEVAWIIREHGAFDGMMDANNMMPLEYLEGKCNL